jgi:hypothetical protein
VALNKTCLIDHAAGSQSKAPISQFLPFVAQPVPMPVPVLCSAILLEHSSLKLGDCTE